MAPGLRSGPYSLRFVGGVVIGILVIMVMATLIIFFLLASFQFSDNPSLFLAGAMGDGVPSPVVYGAAIDSPAALNDVAYVDGNRSVLLNAVDHSIETPLSGALGDYVWNDQDGDLIQDSGEPGLAGLTVRLAGPGGMTTTVTTDVDGRYSFTGLSAGVYTVTIDSSSVPAYLNLVTTPYPVVVWLQAGGVHNEADIGLKMDATSIGDFIWYDANANGVQDMDEPGIDNVLVRLYLDDGDGILDPPSDYLVDSAVTDAMGVYRLDAPVGERYIVDVVDPYGLLSNMIHTLGGQSTSEPTTAQLVENGEQERNHDFGYVTLPDPGQAIIGDLVWVDVDGNGQREPHEPILNGVEVCATARSDNTQRCTFTDLSGRYLIEAPAGEFDVALRQTPTGYAVGTATTVFVSAAAGGQYLFADFGLHGTGFSTISGTIWQDIPVDDIVDGVFSPGEEPVIPMVSVNIIRDLSADQVWDAGEPIIATHTNFAGGDFSFMGLPPGDYLVEVSDSLQVLRSFEPAAIGPNQHADGHNKQQPYALHLAANETNTTADFGYREYEASGQADPTKSAVIGDQVWLDLDRDSVYHSDAAADVPIVGVTVQLASGGAMVATATTDPNGRYLFTELPAGSYSVQVNDAFGVLRAYQSFAPEQTSGQNGDTQPRVVTLAQGQVQMDADFGVQPAFIADATVAILPTNSGPFRPGELLSFRVQVTNSGDVGITALPLRLTFESAYLQFVSAAPAANQSTTGQLVWTDLALPTGELAKGASITVEVNFKASVDSGGRPGGQTIVSAFVQDALADPDGPLGPLGGIMPVSAEQTSVGVQIVSPTTVQLSASSVTFYGDHAEIRWTTVSEADVMGFYLMRRWSDSDWMRASANLIPARNAGRNVGANYFFMDYGASASVFADYRLEVLMQDGHSELLDIDQTGASPLQFAFLPLVNR